MLKFFASSNNSPSSSSTSQEALHAAKADNLVEFKESFADVSNPSNLANESSFNEISFEIDEKVSSNALTIIELLKIKLDSTCESKRENLAYEVLKELCGLRGLIIPEVECADAIYSTVFNRIATDYTKDPIYVNRIKNILGVQVSPDKAKVLRGYFPHFPNIFNDHSIQLSPASQAETNGNVNNVLKLFS